MKQLKSNSNAVFAALLTIGLASTGCSTYRVHPLVQTDRPLEVVPGESGGQDNDASGGLEQGGSEASIPSAGVTSQDDAQAAMKADQTGTNPINFTHDVRLYHEYQFLNTSGDGDQNVTTMEFRTPFADGKWQFRMRGRAQWLDIDGTGGDVSDSGFGDFDFRFLTVPVVDMERKFALAVGLETFLPTATEDSLGSGALSFGPQAFAVFFAPLGIKGTLVAPAYQHKFSVDKDDGRSGVHQGLIDLFFLWISPSRQFWTLVDPQIILDYENSTEFAILDIEAGTMLDSLLGTKGHSVYLRPSVGIGGHRPTDGSIEIGYKIIW